MNNKDTVEAPERIRLVKREGRFANEWYYPDAAIMPFEAEFQYGRVDPPAAPTEDNVIDSLADSIASAINNGALDDRQQRIRDLLVQFAEEIQRRAIEP